MVTIFQTFSNAFSLMKMCKLRFTGGKSSSQPMTVCLLTHICVTPPQWVDLNYPKIIWRSGTRRSYIKGPNLSYFVSGCPCGAWGRGLTMYFLCVDSVFGKYIPSKLFCVSSKEWAINVFYNVKIYNDICWYLLPREYFNSLDLDFYLCDSFYVD